MNCPACGYYNPAGQERCFHCALLLPRSAGADARCAKHPEAQALGACTRCGTFGCQACLTQRGAEWWCEACASRDALLPWDERERLGTWRAWWRTSLRLLSSPGQALSRAEPEAPLGSSVLFTVLSALVGFGPTVLLYAAFFVPLLALSPTRGGDATLMALAPAVLLGYGVLLLESQVAGLFFIAALDHVALLLLGVQPRSYAVSVRAGALAMAPYLLGLVPVCSFYVFPIWALVLRILALMHFHQTTAGKATVAVLAPLVLLCTGVGLLWVLIIGAGAFAGRAF
jgi:hypothetical protein